MDWKTYCALAFSATILIACKPETMENLCVKATKNNLDASATVRAVHSYPTVETPLIVVKYDKEDGTGILKKGEAQCAFERPLDDKTPAKLIGFMLNGKKWKKTDVTELNLLIHQ